MADVARRTGGKDTDFEAGGNSSGELALSPQPVRRRGTNVQVFHAETQSSNIVYYRPHDKESSIECFVGYLTLVNVCSEHRARRELATVDSIAINDVAGSGLTWTIEAFFALRIQAPPSHPRADKPMGKEPQLDGALWITHGPGGAATAANPTGYSHARCVNWTSPPKLATSSVKPYHRRRQRKIIEPAEHSHTNPGGESIASVTQCEY